MPYTETKSLDERVTVAELQVFLRIIDSLPNRKVPPLPSPFLPPPTWNTGRTLPVSGLVQEEEKVLEERWSCERLAKYLSRNKPLRRALRTEQMEPEQFVGFVLTNGLALVQSAVDEDQELDVLLERGELVLRRLRKDDRPYSSLSDDGAYYVLQQAAWLPLIDRVQRLRMVPGENVALVKKYGDRLREIFPAEFQQDPLASLAQVINASGLPFEELAVSGSDTRIAWNAADAIVGKDEPPLPLTEPYPPPATPAPATASVNIEPR